MSITSIAPIDSLQGPWSSLTVELVGPASGSTMVLENIFPFTSINDLKRQLWYQQGGDPRWAPEHVYLSVAGRPLEFHWPFAKELLDPVTNRTPLEAVVDTAGNRKPVGATMVGSLTVEAALAPELQSVSSVARIRAVSLAALQPADSEGPSAREFAGFYQVYFPWLSQTNQITNAASATASAATAIRDAYAAVLPYLEDRNGRIGVVQSALERHIAGTRPFQLQSLVNVRWTLPVPAVKPASLEETFYALPASEALPFMRYYPQAGQGSPILKLAVNPDGSPLIENQQQVHSWLAEPVPNHKMALIIARIPLQNTPGAAFTLQMMNDGDGSTDIRLEVAQKGQRWPVTVATEAERLLRPVLASVGFPADVNPILRGLHATYRWVHPMPQRSSPITPARLQERVTALSPFFESGSVLIPGTLGSFRWRAVSNYESESAQFAWITQTVLAADTAGLQILEEGAAGLAQLTTDFVKRFGVSPETALATITTWMERRGEAIAPAAGAEAGSLAVPRFSTGAFITVSGTHPEYAIEVQDIDSSEELQRILTVVGVVLGAASADLKLKAPSASVAAVAVSVAVADEAVVAAVEAVEEAAGVVPDVGEPDADMAAFLEGLGFGGEDEVPADDIVEGNIPQMTVEETSVSAPVGTPAPVAAMPDLDAAIAEVEEECKGTRWRAGEAALKVSDDYYMERLKKADSRLFGYSNKTDKGTKGYSKSCQRSDGRQPNIMTLSEYARVKRCYASQVRFVDLPPRKSSDLPSFADYNPRKANQYPDEMWLSDPETGKPMWAIYGYESKTNPGEFRYLICAELWCERDNLPLLRTEFAGSEGRGFTKPANSCPFCGGATIANMKSPKPGESVVVRMPKEATGKLHGFIGTITRANKHPEGFPLPCCDTTPRLLKKYMDAKFLGKLKYGRDLGEAEEESDVAIAEAAAEAEGEAAGAAGAGADTEIEPDSIFGSSPDYRRILSSMQTQYILGNDKLLEGGKIGLVPPLLDSFFGQNSQQATVSKSIRTTFTDSAQIFVRLGVQYNPRKRGLNLLSALAPILGFDTPEQLIADFRSAKRDESAPAGVSMKYLIRAFESANYGTLVYEFASKSTLSSAAVDDTRVSEWARLNGYTVGPSLPHLKRLYRAWHTFLKYLDDADQPKQLRHLEHLLAAPGVLSPRGLLLIVLEPGPKEVSVVCPTFGIPPADLYRDVPVAFLWHEPRDDRWTPLVLYNGTSTATRQFGTRDTDLTRLPGNLGKRTKLVRSGIENWLREWRSSTTGCGRPAPPPHVWTPGRDTSSLPRLSQLRFSKIVRDRSNRLAGVLYPTDGPDGPVVFVPCLDDGYLAVTNGRIYEVEGFQGQLASLDATVAMYERLVAEGFTGLRPVAALSKGKQVADPTRVIGLRLASGSRIPVASGPNTTSLPLEPVDQFVWERDGLILPNPNAPPVVIEFTEASGIEEQLAEAYQHLRLSFGRWLNGPESMGFKNDVLAVLGAESLPLYERRKRMDILLEPLLSQWIAVEKTEERRQLPILRQDCLAIADDEARCAAAGACRFGEGRCMIHAPTRPSTGSDSGSGSGPGANPVRIFTSRLSDELLRYADSSRQVLTGTVSAIRAPRGVVRVGDAIYTAVGLKESATAVLQRLGFTGDVPISFPEEMMRFDGMEEEEELVVAAAAAPSSVTDLPAAWREMGFQIAQPQTEDIGTARRLALAAALDTALPTLEAAIQRKRAKYSLPTDIPFQWSVQDFWILSRILLTNILFVHEQGNGSIVIDRWIEPTDTGAKRPPRDMFLMIWGPKQLAVFRGKDNRFSLQQLPTELRTALDSASPMSNEVAMGAVAEEPVAAVSSTVAAVAAVPAEEEEEEAALELAPAPTVEPVVAPAPPAPIVEPPAPAAPAPTVEPVVAEPSAPAPPAPVVEPPAPTVEPPAPAPPAPPAPAEPTSALPPSWKAMGFQVIAPEIISSDNAEVVRRTALEAAFQTTIPSLEIVINRRLAKYKMPTPRPFQWSLQDFWVMARLFLTNFVFAHTEADGSIVIDRWIEPTEADMRPAENTYTIIWGPYQLTVFKGKDKQFYAQQLPAEFREALDTASPMSNEVAKSSVEPIPINTAI